jgi:hypothetical protein
MIERLQVRAAEALNALLGALFSEAQTGDEAASQAPNSLGKSRQGTPFTPHRARPPENFLSAITAGRLRFSIFAWAKHSSITAHMASVVM